jgi:hypothetical protein
VISADAFFLSASPLEGEVGDGFGGYFISMSAGRERAEASPPTRHFAPTSPSGGEALEKGSL